MITTNKTTIKRGAHSKRSVCRKVNSGLKKARERSPMPISDEEVIRRLKKEADRQYAAMLASGVDPLLEFRGALKDSDMFKEGGLAYQRRMRDEWDD